MRGLNPDLHMDVDNEYSINWLSLVNSTNIVVFQGVKWGNITWYPGKKAILSTKTSKSLQKLGNPFGRGVWEYGSEKLTLVFTKVCDVIY